MFRPRYGCGRLRHWVSGFKFENLSLLILWTGVARVMSLSKTIVFENI
jgi:hypothetical protein